MSNPVVTTPLTPEVNTVEAPALTTTRRAENLRLIEEIRKYSWWNIPHEHQSAGNRLAHDLPLYEAALTEALSLLDRVYQEAGNAASPKRRHALTPGLRDDIRDCLKAAGYFGGATP